MSQKQHKNIIFFVILTVLQLLLMQIPIYSQNNFDDDLSSYDFKIAGLTIKDPFNKVIKFLGQPKLIETIKDHPARIPVKVYKIEGIAKIMVAAENNKDWILWGLTIYSSKYPSARDIRVGDSVDKVYENYGYKDFEDYQGYHTLTYQRRSDTSFISFDISKSNRTVKSIEIGFWCFE